MVDNVTTGTTGISIAADDIASVWYQRIKVTVGSSGTATDVTTGDPFPVRLSDGTDMLAIDGSGSAAVILMNSAGTALSTASPLGVKVSDGTDNLAIDTNGSAQVQLFSGATAISSAAPLGVKMTDGTTIRTIDVGGSARTSLYSTSATAISSAVPLGVKMSDGTTNRSIDVGGAARTTLYTTSATAISSAVPLQVQLGDATAKHIVDVGGGSRVTLYTTAATAVTFNNNGRALPSASAPVVFASQRAVSFTSSTATQRIGTTATSGAVSDWLDGFLVTPTSTAMGAITVADGSTGTLVTIVAGGTPNLVPFYVPYPATSVTSAWCVVVGANTKVNAFGNFS